jgi:hypothetical protein
MTCNNCMERLTALDNGDHIPLMVAFHLSRCPDCEKSWLVMTAAYSHMHEQIERCKVELVDTVMDTLEKNRMENSAREGISLKIWLGAGIVILAAMFFSTFAEPFVMARTSLGDLFLMPIGLLFGIVLSVYLVIFIISNMAWLTRFIKIAGFGHR